MTTEQMLAKSTDAARGRESPTIDVLAAPIRGRVLLACPATQVAYLEES
jgi:hypothetical protein